MNGVADVAIGGGIALVVGGVVGLIVRLAMWVLS